jgi:hypothetical protein
VRVVAATIYPWPSHERISPVINASIWLKDEERFTILEDLDHTPRLGEEFEIDGQSHVLFAEYCSRRCSVLPRDSVALRG